MSPAAIVVIATVILSGVAPASQPVEPEPQLKIDLGEHVVIEMVLIEPGELNMGSPAADAGIYYDQMPPHRVKITRPFYLGASQVTQGQWRAVMSKNPSYFQGSDRLPVENVSWEDCQGFIARLNRMVPGGGFRLPTEAEWEYACRAGTATRFSFGNDDAQLSEYAWYAENSENKTHEVATRKPNPWKLFDMHGNVRQWCQDWYAEDYYGVSPSEDPQGPPAGGALPQRVARGGSWIQYPGQCRSAFRSNAGPEQIDNDLGVRLARTVE